MYKVVYHRYGKKYIEDDYETLEKAKSFAEYLSDYGEGFPEYILDDKDIIVWDGSDFVVGIEHENMVGKLYQEQES
ncbi:hypothetical protein ACEPPU_23985 [Priestia aryabhattai]|uniref:hypothetical protein n=1 Tax=Priestia aryabhattai TaxID=412384 RepID=UPI0035AB93C2